MNDLGITDLSYTLPVAWAPAIGAAVAMYVVLDGFDFGIGILFPFSFYKEEEPARDLVMNSVVPFWDGNETWLMMKTGGEVEQRTPRIGSHSLFALLGFIALGYH